MFSFRRSESRQTDEQLKEFARSLPKRLSGPIAIRQAGGSIEQTSLVFRDSEPFAEGGTSVLFRVHNPSLNEDRILKVRTVPLEDSTEWQHEWSTLVELSRRGNICIPKIHSVGTIEDLPVLVMSVVEGQTLRELITYWQNSPALTPSSPAAFLRFIHRLMRGVFVTMYRIGKAGEPRPIHGDLKRGNLILQCRNADGDYWKDPFSVWVLDFGEASLCERQNRGMTPRYASPEQMLANSIQDADPLTPASDQYQLGVMLNDLLDFFERRYRTKLRKSAHLITRSRANALRRLAGKLTARRPSDRCRSFRKAIVELRRCRQPSLRILLRPAFLTLILFAAFLLYSDWAKAGKINALESEVQVLKIEKSDLLQWIEDNRLGEGNGPSVDNAVDEAWSTMIRELRSHQNDIQERIDRRSVIIAGKYGSAFAEQFKAKLYERLLDLEGVDQWRVPLFGIRGNDDDGLVFSIVVDGVAVANRLPIKGLVESSDAPRTPNQWRGTDQGFPPFTVASDSLVEIRLERKGSRMLGMSTGYTIIDTISTRGGVGLFHLGELRGLEWSERLYRGGLTAPSPRLGGATLRIAFERL